MLKGKIMKFLVLVTVVVQQFGEILKIKIEHMCLELHLHFLTVMEPCQVYLLPFLERLLFGYMRKSKVQSNVKNNLGQMINLGNPEKDYKLEINTVKNKNACSFINKIRKLLRKKRLDVFKCCYNKN